MAQADSVASAVRGIITGATLNRSTKRSDRRYFICGSDARIIVGKDEAALLRLWREKRGEAELEDLSGNLVVQLGVVTEELNRRWYEANTGQVITDVQKHIRHPGVRWMTATLDGRVEASGAVGEDSACPLPFGPMRCPRIVSGGFFRLHHAGHPRLFCGRRPADRLSLAH
jgi:hypothetical protein